MEGNESTKTASVYEVAAFYLDQMADVAWSKLGLRPDLVTGKIEPNFGEAKVAIDIVSYLATTVEGQLDDEDRRRVQSLVRDLKINYVQKSQG